MKQYFLFLVLMILYSCAQQEEPEYQLPNPKPKAVKAEGYVVPKDSMAAPKVVKIDKRQLKVLKAGKPKVVATNTNIHKAGKPKIVKAGKPRIIKIGSDTFLLPKKVKATGLVVPCIMPKPVKAGLPVMKDDATCHIQYLDVDQGMNSSYVQCMLRDKTGNLWFGNNGGGVSKYDGASFTHFTEKEGLSNNTVMSIIEDKTGNLWFGTHGGGVSKYDGSSFTHFTEKQGLSNNCVFSIIEDKTGNLWFGTSNGGVCKYDGASFTHFAEKQGLSNNTVWSIMEDKTGNIWFGTSGGVSKYDGASFTHFTEKQELSNNTVLSIIEDKTGNLWFGTSGGAVSKYDGQTFTHFTEKQGLSNYTVRSIMEDKTGNLWFGTDGGGVSKYDGVSFTHFTEKQGLSNNTVWSIIEDKTGSLWFGTDGGGVCKYDGGSFTHFTEKQGLSNNKVWSIMEDRTGNLWFGKSSGGVNRYDGASFIQFTEKQGLSNKGVLSIIEDKTGNLWFGTSGGVSKYDGASFTHFTEKQGLSNNIVLSIIEDKTGNLWFGTGFGGVCKYDGASFTHFTEKQGLSNNAVLSIIEDKTGNLWFGTYGGGVCKYEPSSKEGQVGTLTHFTEKEGLSNNDVMSIIEGPLVPLQETNLYFATEKGLSNFTISKSGGLVAKLTTKDAEVNTAKWVIFKKKDGLKAEDFLERSAFIDSKGNAWWGSGKALTRLNVKDYKLPHAAPLIQMGDIELNESFIDYRSLTDSVKDTLNIAGIGNMEFKGVAAFYNYPKELELPYNLNHLTFSFSAIDWAAPHKLQYQYKLVGLDKNWSELSHEHKANYRNIPFGTFTFKVRAIGVAGKWSNTFEYSFVIQPPWWRTWWAYSIYFITIISSVWYYIKWREKALKQRQVELEHTVEVRTAEVVEQKHIIEEKHKEITDSINYAERIQRSFMATTDLLNENLKDYFVLFEPKDVVSGDFYWASTLNNGNFVLATADSTGHGVPGAIMSILNISSLEKALEEQSLNQPNEILNYTRTKIIERLKKDGSTEGGKDGMDCSLISFDFNNKQITYAAANNPIWIIRSGELLEFKPDKMPVGKHEKDSVPFSQHTVAVEKGDVIYTLTDGLPDQFGGEKGKKLMYKQLKELLLGMVHLSMQEQKEKLKKVFIDWKGDLEQVDDVCVIGVRVG